MPNLGIHPAKTGRMCPDKTKKNFRKALKQHIENSGKHVSKKMYIYIYTLWLFNIAMENGP